MGESSYGLIVEGDYDEAVFPELIRKIASPEAEVIVRTAGGVAQLMKHFPGFLRELEHARSGHPVDKAMVIRDWRGPDLLTIEDKMARRVQGKHFAFPRGVQFCAVKQEMETWLLADVDAVNSVSQPRGGRNVSSLRQELEQIGNPKERLRDLLSKARLPYDPEICRQIARAAEIGRLHERCPSFRSFQMKVIDC